QNFLPKAGTAMHRHEPCDPEEFLWSIAAARLVPCATSLLQAPPTLSDDLGALLAAGIDDWGGVSPVTPDHVNPERPWPDLDRLTELTGEAGFTLKPRLTVHPRCAGRAAAWIDARLGAHVGALAGPDGLANGQRPVPRPWQADD